MNYKEINADIKKFAQSLSNDDDNFDIEYETRMLTYRFLNIIDEIMEDENISKKELAEKIGTSASYITQLFRGSKILNMPTLAKFQNALNFQYKIRNNNKLADIDSSDIKNYIEKNIGKNFYLVYKKKEIAKYCNEPQNDSTTNQQFAQYA